MRRWISTRLLPFGLASLAGGCTLERPEGAYYPVYQNDTPPDLDDLEAGVPVLDSQVGFFDDEDAGADAGGGSAPTQDPALAELVGAYWVRIDDYSRAQSTVSRPPITVNISVRTRISYMGVAFISEADGQLVSKERICQQTYAHTCTEGCVNGSTKTVVDPRALARLNGVKPTGRRLTLDRESGLLTGEQHAFPLGYEGTGDDSLPVSESDPRAWEIDSSLSGPEAFYTQATAAVRSLGVTRTADCRLSLALRFANQWSVNLGKTGEAFILDGVSSDGGGTLDLSATKSTVLRARGYQDATDSDCKGDSATGDGSTPVRRSIRFAKVSEADIGSCPSIADYDRKLPADAP